MGDSQAESEGPERNLQVSDWITPELYIQTGVTL